MNSKASLTAAVLGTGFMGRQYIDVLRDRVDELIVCSADESGRRLAEELGLRYYGDYEELFASEKPDFSAICLPTPLHHPAAMAALSRGIHVLCEKPFAATAAEAREMIAASEANFAKLMIGHILRFDGYFEYLKNCIEDRSFGRLISLELFRHHPRPDWSVGNWLDDERMSGGMIRDLHIHDTDMVHWLLGVPKRVYTTGSSTNCTTVYRFANDVSVSASASWRSADFSPCHGYDAVFENACIRRDTDSFTVTAAQQPDIDDTDALIKEIEYFINCVENNEAPAKCMPVDSLTSFIISDAEISSLRTKLATAVF